MKMSATVDKNIIETELIKIIREILKDAAAEIDPEKSLMTQYGLDSLDLLDFSFNIEEKFGVQIGPEELRGRADSRISKDEMFDENGNISNTALAELKKNIPELPAESFVYGMRPEDIPTLLNIRVFVRIVLEKLNAANFASLEKHLSG